VIRRNAELGGDRASLLEELAGSGREFRAGRMVHFAAWTLAGYTGAVFDGLYGYPRREVL
jgi:hypothetical protein